MSHKIQTPSLLAKAKAITNWSDEELASVVGLARPTVHAYVSGRLPEYLDGLQISALLGVVRLHRDRMIDGVEELEMLT